MSVLPGGHTRLPGIPALPGDMILAICADLGVLLSTEKLEEPAQCLTFPGIELDTQAGVMHLPVDKLSWLKDLLAQCPYRSSASGSNWSL